MESNSLHESPLHALHLGAGARLVAAPAGGEEPLSFGDVPAEYAAGTDGCALFDVTARELLLVEGADAVDFLHRILANHVRELADGAGNRQLLLTAKGKVRHVFDLERDGDGFRLSSAPGTGAALAQGIDTYLFTERVTIRAASDEHAPLELCGPRADEVVAAVCGAVLPVEERRAVRIERGGGALRLARLSVAGGDGWRLDAGRAGAAELWSALVAAGATPCGRAARDILRVEACCAEPGVDVDENVYPQEARLFDAYADDKGCYIGQEVVAKIDTYGGLNKQLLALRIAHDDFVPRGTPLVQRDEESGEVRELGLTTSWAYSFVLDTGLALGYVKRRHQDVGTTLRLGGADGAQAVVVAVPVRASARPVSAARA